MNKPYLLFRNHQSPYWYAQIRLPDGSLSNNKSTGKESRTEAEKVVMQWVVNGECPKRVSGKSFHKKQSNRMIRIIFNYWEPLIKGKTVGEITQEDIRKTFRPNF